MSSAQVPAVEGGSRKHHKPITFKTYIHRVIKSNLTGYNLSGEACQQVNIILKIFSELLSEQARKLTIDNKHRTVTVKELSVVMDLNLDQEFYEMVNETSQQAISDYNDNVYDAESDQPRSKANRAGLIFPPHICEKYLRQHNASGLSVSQTAPIYLAGFLETLCLQWLSSAITVTDENKKSTITPRHLFLGRCLSPFLNTLFNKFNIQEVGCGIVPGIQDKLIPDQKKKKELANKRRKARSEGKNVTSSKSLPGTVSLKNIKSLQKTNELLLLKDPFRRFFKSLYGDQVPNFEAGVLDTIQNILEQQTITFLVKSVENMIHAKRITLKPADINKYLNDIECLLTDELVDKSFEPGIRRLGFRAGVKTMSKTSLEILRQYLYSMANDIAIPSIKYMNYYNGKTITHNIIAQVCANNGMHVPIESRIRSSGRKKAAGTEVKGEGVEGDVDISEEEDGEGEEESEEEDATLIVEDDDTDE